MSRFRRTDNTAQDQVDNVSSTTSVPAFKKQPQHEETKTEKTSTSVEVGEDRAELQARLTKVQQKRMRYEFELEKTQRDLEQCQKEAQALGVSSIEDLEKLVNKLEQEDKKNMEAFLKDLFAEESKLDQIDQQLTKLEQER